MRIEVLLLLVVEIALALILGFCYCVRTLPMRVQYRRCPYPWVKLSVPNGRIPRVDVERTCTPRIAAPRILPTVRPVGEDYVTHPYWLPLWKDDLA
jgi:hypothetical protein